MKNDTLDLTQGPIMKQLLTFFLPILYSSLFQQLYATIDAIIVGRMVGKIGLASIDSIAQLLYLPITFFNGLAAGSTIMISQYFGRKDFSNLSDSEHTTIAFAFVGGLCMSLLGYALAPWCLSKMSIPQEIYPYTLSYAKIFFGGLGFALIYNLGAGILRAVGNTKVPFHILIVAGCVNVGLDLLFVGPFKMGVKGAALATTLAQGVSAFLVIRALLHSNSVYHLSFDHVQFHKEHMIQILKYGLPTALQFSLYPIANILIQIAVNSMGTNNIAAYGLTSKLALFMWIQIDSLGPCITTFVAQNIGANDTKRAVQGIHAGLILGHLMVGISSLILYFYCVPLGKLFINEAGYDILPLMEDFMHYLAPYFIFYVFGSIYGCAIQGTGKTVPPFLVTLSGTCIFRVIWMLAYIPTHNNMHAILASYTISYVLTTSLFILYYIPFKKKYLSY